MNRRHLVLGAMLIGAAGLAAFGNRQPRAEVAEAIERPATRVAPISAPRTNEEASNPASGKEQPILALVPRETLVGDGDTRFAQGESGAGAGANAVLFGHQDWTPPPPPPAPAPPPPPPPLPSAPPLPFVVIGKSVSEGVWEVYLAHGERTYVVHAQDLIEGTYRIDAIAPPLMTLTYLPLKQVQQLNIGVFD